MRFSFGLTKKLVLKTLKIKKVIDGKKNASICFSNGINQCHFSDFILWNPRSDEIVLVRFLRNLNKVTKPKSCCTQIKKSFVGKYVYLQSLWRPKLKRPIVRTSNNILIIRRYIHTHHLPIMSWQRFQRLPRPRRPYFHRIIIGSSHQIITEIFLELHIWY